MYETDNVFILKGLTIDEKTDADWEKERIIFNLDLPDNRKMDLENFKNFQKSFSGCHDYKISEYNHAYFFKEEVAIEAAKGNMGGLDDGGVYKYCMLIEVPCGVSYPEFGEIISMHLFKFNFETREFGEIYTGKEFEAVKKQYSIFD